MYIKNITCLIILYLNIILCHKHSKTKINHIYASNLYNDNGTTVKIITPTTKHLPTDFYI